MADEHETIADIIAEMRMRSDEAYKGSFNYPECQENQIEYDEASEWADRLEAAHKREATTPKSNPDWKNICARCAEGDIEPRHCEYFGEPNGCNSPIYGEHPTDEKSSAVGDAAKLREALIKARTAICQFARHQCQSLSWENSNIQANCGDVLCSWRGLCDAKTAINAALAATEQKGETDGNE